MSSTDKRIVQMEFDNKQFEAGAKATIDTLEKLKKSLNLDGAAKGLNGLGDVTKGFSLDGIGAGVDQIAGKFTALGIIGVTALTNITNSAINAGKRIVSALTIDPISSGFNEYELKMGSIQTIMAGTGESLQTVNKYLEELNKYSDDTIYSFADMTSNIGKFTNAGVGLEDAVNAIKGISNAAALSGANSEEASRAMYNFSQALSAGYVKLIDWKSIENANMATVEFKTQLIESALAMGSITDAGDGMYKTLEGNVFNATTGFNEVLQDQWMTTDVLVGTLNEYADSTTEIGARASAAATDIKTFTQLYDTLKEAAQSGWAQSWELIVGDFEEAKVMLTQVSEAIGGLIAASADSRIAILTDWKALGGRTVLIEAIAEAFGNLMSFLEPIKAAFDEIFPPMTGERLYDLTVKFKELMESFKMEADTLEDVKETFKGIFSALELVGKIIWGVAEGVYELFRAFMPGTDSILALTAGFGSFVTELNKSIDVSAMFQKAVDKIKEHIIPLEVIVTNLKDSMMKILGVFINLGKGIANVFSRISQAVLTGFENFSFEKLFDVVHGGLFASILLGIKKFIGSLNDMMSEGGILGNLASILDGVRGSLEAYQSNLKSKTLMNIALAIGILAAALFVIASVDSDKLSSSLGAITIMMAQLFGAMALFGKVSGGFGIVQMGVMTSAMIGMSTAILILSIAMKQLGDLDWGDIAKGLVSVAALSGILILSAELLSRNSGKMIQGAFGFIVFAGAIILLTQAVKIMGDLHPHQLVNGLLGVGIVLLELAAFMKIANLSGMSISTGAGILLMAGAIGLLARAVETFGDMDIASMMKGLAGVGLILLQLSLFAKFTGGTTNMIATATGLFILGAAMLIFSKAIESMGSMPLHVLANGLLTMAATLTILAVALNFMQNAIPGAAALVLVSGALMGLALVLQMLGSMSVGEIVKSLLTLVGVFAIIGGASLLLAPIVPAMLSLAGAMALLGVAVTLIGGGLLMLSAAFTALAISGVAGAAALVVAVTSVISLVPMLLEQVGKGVIAFARVIGDGAPAIVEAIMKVLNALLDALIQFIPKLVEGGMKLLMGILKGISDNIYKIVQLAVEIMINFINGITSMIPKLMQAGVDLILGFINGLADTIRENDGLTIEAIENLMSSITEAGLSVLTGSISSFGEAGIAIVEGLIGGIKGMGTKAWNAMQGLGSTVLSSFSKKMEIRSPSRLMDHLGRYVVDGLAEGIEKNTKAATSAEKQGDDVATSMAKGLTKSTPKIKQAATDMSKSVFEITKAWIDKRRTYNQISLEDELAKWESIQAQYKKGSDERLEIDKRMYEIKKQMIKDSFDHSVKWIDEEKYYKRLSLADELAAWERVQARYLGGTEERKKADREVFRLKNEMTEKQKKIDEDYYNSTKAINDKLIADTKRLQDEYDRAVDSRADTLANSYGLFDKVSENEDPVSGQDLLSNLEGQVDAFDDWQKEIKRLSKKGIDEGLVDELRKMGPRSLEQIQALNSLSSKELDKYSDLWQEKHESAKDQAVLELKGLRRDTEREIKALEEQSEKDLESYKMTWMNQIAELTGGVVQSMDTMGANIATSVQATRATTEQEFAVMGTNIQTTLNTQNWGAVGLNIVQGITNGVKNNSQLLISEMTSLAQRAIQATEKELGIRSPSKVFEGIGKYSVEGFVNGLSKYAKVVGDAATDVGKTAMSSLSSSVAKISDIISSDIDMNPTVRPVLDLSDIRAGAGRMDGMFGELAVAGSMGRASTMGSYRGNNTANDIREALKSGMAKTQVDLDGTLQVQVVNDKGEIIGIAKTAIKDLLREESR